MNVLDATKFTLDEWLALLATPPSDTLFMANRFPTDEHRDEFLDRLPAFSPDVVKGVLRRFLISTGSAPCDVFDGQFIFERMAAGGLSREDLTEQQRRNLRHYLDPTFPAWEGLHWVLDLLPSRPRQALSVLDAFLFAECQFMSDNYLIGHSDAAAIIRHGFIRSPGTRVDAESTLDGLSWRELEWLAGTLYKEIGFEVVVTPRGNDDGVDVLASQRENGQPARLVIQVKRRVDNPVSKAEFRELVGTIDHQRATGGVLLTSGRFTSGCHKLEEQDPRVRVVDREMLIEMLNEHCGTDWYRRVDYAISELKREQLVRSQ